MNNVYAMCIMNMYNVLGETGRGWGGLSHLTDSTTYFVVEY